MKRKARQNLVDWAIGFKIWKYYFSMIFDDICLIEKRIVEMMIVITMSESYRLYIDNEELKCKS